MTWALDVKQKYQCDWLIASILATPFKIHTPPVEVFQKVSHRGSVNFQMH